MPKMTAICIPYTVLFMTVLCPFMKRAAEVKFDKMGIFFWSVKESQETIVIMHEYLLLWWILFLFCDITLVAR
jgi:hypothetical protein